MLARLSCLLISVCVGISFLSTPALSIPLDQAAKKLEAFKWYVEEYPPYNFKNKAGETTGMAVDILMAAFRKIGIGLRPKNLEIAPWNQAYKAIQMKPGTALFSMTYTPERQQIMKFVGPSVPSNISIIAARAKKLSNIDTAQLAGLKIAVVRDDIGDQLMRKFALSDDVMWKKNSLKQVLDLLFTERVDAVAYAVDVFNWATKAAGVQPAL
ncbi:MAG: transporter substrate-binding domain-containing protein, partial [Rhodospirillaceae bacterium]|nr:transporter substrate-binding domain-containing protein [Rhodospirillaceae bacterium]